METKSSFLFKDGDNLELPPAYDITDFPYICEAKASNSIYTISTSDKSRLYLHPTSKVGIYKLKSSELGSAVWPETVANKVAALFWDKYRDKNVHFQIHPLDGEIIAVYGMKTPEKIGEVDIRHKLFCYFCCKVSEEKLLQCSRCKWTRYCNRECQKADWKRHRKECVSKSKECVSKSKE